MKPYRIMKTCGKKLSMKTSFTDTYDRDFLFRTMMGPNAMCITKELVAHLCVSPEDADS